MYPLHTTSIAPGVIFHSIPGAHFKTNRVAVLCFRRLQPETASAGAILPFLLRKHCRSMPDMNQLGQQLQDLYGASLGADCRKMGDTQILMMAVGCLDDSLALQKEPVTRRAADILAQLLLDPVLENGRFLQEDVELEKKNLEQLIESEYNEKRMYAIGQAVALMAPGQPFGCNRYGTVEQVRALTAETVTAAYHELLRSSEIHIFFTGKGNPEPVQEVFARAFAKVERGDVQAASTAPFFPRQTEPAVRVETAPVAQSKLVLCFAAPAETEEEKNALFLMTALFGGTPISKLFTVVREKLSLCYYCAARYDRQKGVLMVDSGVEHHNIAKAREAILEQLEEIKRGSFPEEQMQQTALAACNSFRAVGDSSYALESWYLSQVYSRTALTPRQQMEAICRVTREQIIAAAKRVTFVADYTLTGEGEA